MTVFVDGAAAIPITILQGLTFEAARLNNVELIHLHVVSEYGVVNVFGKSLCQRAIALFNIAHPDHRNQLEKVGSYSKRNKDDGINLIIFV
jgi:hypothetical protein